MNAKRTTPYQSLLQGRPYTPAAATDVAATFLKYGWVPPSSIRKDAIRDHLKAVKGGAA